MSDNPWLRGLVPHNAQRRRWKPTEGSAITVTLPGEKVMATVVRVADDLPDSCIVQLESVPMGKTHSYRRHQIFAAKRAVNELGVEEWVPVDERELAESEAVRRFEASERQRVEAEKAATVAPAELPKPPEENWSA